MKVYNLCAYVPVPSCIRGTRDWGWLCPCSCGIVCLLLQRTLLIVAMSFLSVSSSANLQEGDSLSINVPDSALSGIPVSVPPSSSDSTYDHDVTAFHPRQLILPAALIATGTYGVCNGWFHGVNDDVRSVATEMRGSCYWHVDDYLQYLPVLSNVAMGSLGIKTRHPLRERIAVTATSYMAMGIMVNVGKRTFRERRPDSNARNSFPSGHTATAFMGAELVRLEYGGAYGCGAYIVATGIAVLRLYNERHWLNDVIAGAGIGILSARIGYWLLPLSRRLFGWNCSGSPTVVLLPTLNPDSHIPGLAMSISL